MRASPNQMRVPSSGDLTGTVTTGANYLANRQLGWRFTAAAEGNFSAPATVAAMQRAYFWFSRPAPGGSVGVTTR